MRLFVRRVKFVTRVRRRVGRPRNVYINTNRSPRVQ